MELLYLFLDLFSLFSMKTLRSRHLLSLGLADIYSSFLVYVLFSVVSFTMSSSLLELIYLAHATILIQSLASIK